MGLKQKNGNTLYRLASLLIVGIIAILVGVIAPANADLDQLEDVTYFPQPQKTASSVHFNADQDVHNTNNKIVGTAVAILENTVDAQNTRLAVLEATPTPSPTPTNTPTQTPTPTPVTLTVSDTGPTDNINVAGVSAVRMDCRSNTVTIGGFVNGVNGQVLFVFKQDNFNHAILEHEEGHAYQEIFMSESTDGDKRNYGGWTLWCDGSNWYHVGY